MPASRSFDEVMIVNPYDPSSSEGGNYMRFYRPAPSGLGYYAAPAYGYAPAYNGYAGYAEPPEYGYYAEAPEYGAYAQPQQYGAYAEPPEYGYYAEPPEYGSYAEPPEYGYFAEAPEYAGYGYAEPP